MLGTLRDLVNKYNCGIRCISTEGIKLPYLSKIYTSSSGYDIGYSDKVFVLYLDKDTEYKYNSLKDTFKYARGINDFKIQISFENVYPYPFSFDSYIVNNIAYNRSDNCIDLFINSVL